MKIVLLGASGQLGREWQSVLEQRDSDEIELLPYDSGQLDITHYQEVSDELRRQQPDAVVNCAAYTDVDGAEEHRKEAHKLNVESVLYLAEFSNELEFTLLHYSTDYVFPGSEMDRSALPDGYPEDYDISPVNWYGRTKWEGEQAIRNTTGDHLIVRASWLCGQFGSNFVKTMMELGRERNQLQLVDDQFGSPTFTRNLVYNSLQLLQTESKGTFHVTSKGLISWYDFARAVFSMRDIDVELERVSSDAFSTKAERPAFSKLDTGKIESVAGSEIINWKEGLRELLSQL